VIVRHSRGEYPIHFGPFVQPTGTWLVDENVLACWPGLQEHGPIVVPGGESSKSLECYGWLVQELATRGVRRDQQVIAVGGGVIGDLVGFAASSYLRGIRFVQVPTTLLAMVDSSVGGKVGIDLPQGKNLVGAFWPPQEVWIDPAFLTTLEPRHFRNGMAEVWKYAFIEDLTLVELIDWMKDDPLAVIRRCVEIKAQIVEEDEFDRTGRRAILNFGHTFGHAIEVVHRYETYLHGEAISMGMVAEARLGESLGVAQSGTADFIEAKLALAGLPVRYDAWKSDALIQAMRLDKKNEGDGLAFSLVTEPGRCKLFTGIAEAEVRAFLESL